MRFNIDNIKKSSSHLNITIIYKFYQNMNYVFSSGLLQGFQWN